MYIFFRFFLTFGNFSPPQYFANDRGGKNWLIATVVVATPPRGADLLANSIFFGCSVTDQHCRVACFDEKHTQKRRASVLQRVQANSFQVLYLRCGH